MNLAVLASGYGSNLQAIIDAIKKGRIKAKLTLVISDREDAFALKRAHKAEIRALFLDPVQFKAQEAFDAALINALDEAKIDLVVLAGFMRILSPAVIRRYDRRILNVHPSLLPAFKGARAIRDAFDYGVKVTGVTVHFVEDKLDSGPIIFQEPLPVRPKETFEALEARIHQLEHKLYPKAIDWFVRGRLRLEGRKVKVGKG